VEERTQRSGWGSVWRLSLGPALFALVLLLGPGEEPGVARMAGIAAWMAAWWITEAVPIPVTALLPLVLMPALGVLPIREVAPNYARSTIFLFLGGFLLALGLQASGAHRRMALALVHVVGGGPSRLALGFLLASGGLSMWISNTATAMVLLPIGLSVIGAAQDRGAKKEEVRALGLVVMLSIAYGGNIGGMATPVGTPPNLSYKEQLIRLFPDAPSTGFAEWMLLGVPLAAMFLVVAWLVLTRVVVRTSRGALLGGREAVASLRRGLGPPRRDEVITIAVFALTALLWVTRKGLELGPVSIPGWESIGFLTASYLDDAVVAVATAMLLFVIPSQDRPGEQLLEWRMATDVPWGMLLLFGGGFALAAGFQASGLSAWLGEQLGALEGAPLPLVVAVVCFSLSFLTELTSNTATTEMVLPVLAAAGVAMGVDPRALMVPATLSASCAFMMPVATPTNAIVFGSGWVPIRSMVRAGFLLNLIGVVLVTLTFLALGRAAMGVQLDASPEWAVPAAVEPPAEH
jgi:sodium-dependent dicarboxylate transporter 2/3/5